MNIDVSNAHCGPRILFPDHVWLRVVSNTYDCLVPRSSPVPPPRGAEGRPGPVVAERIWEFAGVVRPRLAATQPASPRNTRASDKKARASDSARRVLGPVVPVRPSCPRCVGVKHSSSMKTSGFRAHAEDLESERAPARIVLSQKIFYTRPQSRRDYPLNLSILLSGGKETN